MRLATVVRREYVERVRSRAFLVSTFLGPVLLAAFLIGPSMIMERQRGQPLRIAVVDATGALRPGVEHALARGEGASPPRFVVVPLPAGSSSVLAGSYSVPAASSSVGTSSAASSSPPSSEEARQVARREIVAGRLDGLLYLGPDALRDAQAEYYGKNVSNMMDLRSLESAADDAMVARRMADEGLDPDRVKSLTRRLDLRKIRVTATGEREDRGQTFLLAMLLLTMLYTTVAMWGAAIMSGVIEEKSNRVVEVIVSSIPTSTLFAGKLLGVGGAGLTQFVVWALTLGGLSSYSLAAAGDLSLPEVSPLLLASFVVYFLLGFFLYGSLYAAVGASVNTQQEAQSLAFPVMMPLILGFVFFPVVLGNPDSALSVVLSLVPLFTPMLMFLRITVVPPPAWQIALSLVLTLGTVASTTWFAARVYRVGILMYGKRPTFPEIVRWARGA
jgi:ABC-2 type transport system permease protein